MGQDEWMAIPANECMRPAAVYLPDYYPAVRREFASLSGYLVGYISF